MKFDVSGKLYTDFELHELAIDTLERAEAAEAEAEALRDEMADYLGIDDKDERTAPQLLDVIESLLTQSEQRASALREQLATVTLERDAALESIKAMRDNVAQIELNREASQAHWLDEALNSGDGTYRP